MSPPMKKLISRLIDRRVFRIFLTRALLMVTTFVVISGADTSLGQTLTINVNAVNDAPSFTRGADQTVNEDATAQTVCNWATSISSGPADESGQTLTFTVTNDNNSLFSVQPAISAAGAL